jgi:hypothetical protein
MMVNHQVIILSEQFPMVPPAIIESLAADAVAWLEQAGDAVTEEAVRRLVIESLELRLRRR